MPAPELTRRPDLGALHVTRFPCGRAKGEHRRSIPSRRGAQTDRDGLACKFALWCRGRDGHAVARASLMRLYIRSPSYPRQPSAPAQADFPINGP
jgi:hypothetical protein